MAISSGCARALPDGQQRWCQPQVNARYFSSFQSANGVVYTNALNGTSNFVFALSEADGRLMWRFRSAPVDLLPSERELSESEPLLDHGTVYVSTSSGVCALQGNLGTSRWCMKLAEPHINGLAVDQQLYVRAPTSAT